MSEGSSGVFRTVWFTFAASAAMTAVLCAVLAWFDQTRASVMFGAVNALGLVLAGFVRHEIREAMRTQSLGEVAFSWFMGVACSVAIVLLYIEGKGRLADILTAVVGVVYLACVAALYYGRGRTE